MVNYITYTKDDGDISERKVITVANPRPHYLMYDVTKLTDEEVNILVTALEITEECRDNAIKDFELLTGIKANSLWRSFKSEGISWED